MKLKLEDKRLRERGIAGSLKNYIPKEKLGINFFRILEETKQKVVNQLIEKY